MTRSSNNLGAYGATNPADRLITRTRSPRARRGTRGPNISHTCGDTVLNSCRCDFFVLSGKEPPQRTRGATPQSIPSPQKISAYFRKYCALYLCNEVTKLSSSLIPNWADYFRSAQNLKFMERKVFKSYA